MNDWVNFFIVLLCLGGAIILSSSGCKRGALSAELARKIVHMTMGVVAMSFPWVFQTTLSVQVLGGVAFLTLLLLKKSSTKLSLGSSLFSIQRASIGELLFPIAIAWLFTIGKENPLPYVIALLLLTFADAFSALVGTKYGKRHYTTLSGQKTLEGSLTFFGIAFLCTLIPLYGFLNLPITALLLLACTTAVIATYVEGISSHGLDNLLLPIIVYFTLDYYLYQAESALWGRFIALGLLSLLVIFLHPKNSFDGAGSLGCILFAFIAFSMGGLYCLIAVLILFGYHLLIIKKYDLSSQLSQSITVIFWIAFIPLTWLTFARLEVISIQNAQVLFITNLTAITAMLSAGTSHHLGLSKLSIWTTILFSILGLLPLTFLAPFKVTFLFVPILSVILAVFIFRVKASMPSELIYWISISGLALIHSLVVQFLILKS